MEQNLPGMWYTILVEAIDSGVFCCTVPAGAGGQILGCLDVNVSIPIVIPHVLSGS